MALPGAGWPPLPLAMSFGPTVMIVILCYQTWDMGAETGQRRSNFDRNTKTSAHHSYTVDSEPRVCRGYVFSFSFPKTLQ